MLSLLITEKTNQVALSGKAYTVRHSPNESISGQLPERIIHSECKPLALSVPQPGTGYSIASVEIEDTPSFAYRGLDAPCFPSFLLKEFIKKQIDALAYYKINRLHLHLTDAAGWRH